MNTIKLAKQLISIPSYKGKEEEIGNFLFEYLKENFPWLTVRKQYVSSGRFNIFAKDEYKTKLFVSDHIDTVEPSNGWTVDPFNPPTNDKKVVGLGASDTKGSIASFLSVLSSNKETKGLAMLWYIDEEYGFEGMKKFSSSPLAKKINPKFILSIDGDGLQFGTACRGLVEYKLFLEGKTGHSAKNNGVSVNKQFIQYILDLEDWLKQFSSPQMGNSTVNIARISSGFCINKENNTVYFSESGNRIPDYLEGLIEIRTTSPNLNFKLIKEVTNQICNKLRLKIVLNECRYDQKGYETNWNKISAIMKNMKTFVNKGFLDPSTFGYSDVSMLQALYPEASILALGAGTKNQAHSPDEYIYIKDLEKATRAYTRLLKNIV